MDILCFSTTDWDEIWGSRQQLMQRIVPRGHRVLFIERQVGPEHLLRDPHMRQRKLAAWKQPALRVVQDNLWCWQPPLMPPGRYYSLGLNRLGQRYLAARVRRVMEALGFNRPLLWLYPPHSAPLLGQFSERLSVYHCIDRFAGEQTGRKRQVMQAQEAALLSGVDRVFVHAEGLRRLHQPLVRRPITLVPSAADVAHFQSTAEIHPKITALPRPRLGLAGTIDGRLDVPLLTDLAQAHPEWHLVLIGQVRPGRVNLEPLTSCSNVHLLGARPFAELPALLNGMDALLIPYVHNELTDTISPLKLYEYLALGQPIVSVDLPEVRPLQQWVATAEGPQAFAAAVQQVLAQETPARRQERRQVAWQHTWDARLDSMWTVIEAALAERGQGAG